MTERIDICDCSPINIKDLEEVKKRLPDDNKMELLSSFYKAFSDTTKVKILWILDIKEMCVCDIAVLTNLTKSAVSHQLSNLKRLNLVKSRRDGKIVYYSLVDDCVRGVLEKGFNHSIDKK